jgi:hypothetical protein
MTESRSRGTFLQGQIAATDHVVVTDRRPAAVGQHDRAISGEADAQAGVGIELDALDLADLDTGDADQVAGL